MNETAVIHQPDAPPPIAGLPRRTLRLMLEAGEEVLECQHALHKGGLNIVGELLKGQGTFYEYNHYPEGDVFDPDSHSQYYYHAHPDRPGEHGHFHTFVRRPGMPAGVAQVDYQGEECWPQGDEALSHLIAISMDPHGLPIGLFATNRWVTAENWYPATDVVRMLELFEIEHAYTSWPVNRWLGAMIRLFKPQIEVLLHQRDTVVADWVRDHPDIDVFEDRDLEVTGKLDISVDAQISAIEAGLGGGTNS